MVNIEFVDIKEQSPCLITNRHNNLFAEKIELTHFIEDGQMIINYNVNYNSHLDSLKKGENISEYIKKFNFSDVTIDWKGSEKDIEEVVLGFLLGSWTFDKYKTQVEKSHLLCKVIVDNPQQYAANFKKLQNIAKCIFLTKNLIHEPSNYLHPQQFCNILKELYINEIEGFQLNILTHNDIKNHSLNLIDAVGRASIHPPMMAVMQWKGDVSSSRFETALIGKGVTFDTGGISLKPANKMDEMKKDMTGAAVVLGKMQELVLNNVKKNVVGIIPLVENNIGGNAYKPGDVIKSFSGKTVEILNTDAEGRLILADAISYAVKMYNPQKIIDIATLTGAVGVALGEKYCAIMGNNVEFRNSLIDSTRKANVHLWPLPLHGDYDKMLDSKIADIKNIAENNQAGSIIGGQFIGRFVPKSVLWAHLDIACMKEAEKLVMCDI